jgi:hypothetical protein
MKSQISSMSNRIISCVAMETPLSRPSNFYLAKIRNELIRWEKQPQVQNLIIKPIFFCQEKNKPVYVIWN